MRSSTAAYPKEIYLMALALALQLFITSGVGTAAGGETYKVSIDLPDEALYDVTVADMVPVGVIYEEGSLTVYGAATDPKENVGSPNDGSRKLPVQWNLGDIDNTLGQDIILEFRLMVSNAESNRAGIMLEENKVAIHWKDAEGRTHSVAGSSHPVKLVEPLVGVEMKASPDSGAPGSSTRFVLSVFHRPDSHAAAFDLNVTAQVPDGFTLQEGSARIVSGPPGVIDGEPSKITWHFDEAGISWAGEDGILLQFDAHLDPGISPNQTLTSAAEAVWSSTPRDDTEERHYSSHAEGPFRVLPHGVVLEISATRLDDHGSAILPGDLLEYSVICENKGPDDAVGVVLRADCDPWASLQTPVVDGPLDGLIDGPFNLSSGEPRQIRVSLNVRNDTPNGTVIETGFSAECNQSSTSCTQRATAIWERRVHLGLYCIHPKAAAVGDLVGFSYILINEGEAPIYEISLEDVTGDVSLQSDSLLPGERQTAESNYRVSGADIPGPIQTTAIAGARYSSIVGPRHDGTVSAEARSKIEISHIGLMVLANTSAGWPEEDINYTYTVMNNGSTILQIESLMGERTQNITPAPGGIIMPGEIKSFYGNYTVLDDDPTTLLNNATVKALDSWGNEVMAFASASVDIGAGVALKSQKEPPTGDGGLWIAKEANNTNPIPGAFVLYKVTYGNTNEDTAADISVTDVLPDVEYVSADPEPTAIRDNVLVWSVPDLSADNRRSIQVLVKISERPRIAFGESSVVRGRGYAYRRALMNTGSDPHSLVNYANITGKYPGKPAVSRETSSIVVVGNVVGNEMKTTMHGSGNLSETLTTSMDMSSRQISMSRKVSADHGEAYAPLPGERNIIYSSLWAEGVAIKSRIRDEMMAGSYLYTKGMKGETSVIVDDNLTIYKSKVDMDTGQAEMRLLKKAPDNKGNREEISEGYHGSFSIEGQMTSYGSGVNYTRGASGKGFVSSDKRVLSSLRSFEHGSGTYSSAEAVDSWTIRKDITVSYSPERGVVQDTNYTSRWYEGTDAWDERLGSKISMRIREADNITRNTEMTTSSMETSAEWSGLGSLQAGFTNTTTKEGAFIDEVFAGRYEMKVKMGIARGTILSYPHINVTKRAISTDDSTAIFWINVTNEGDTKFEPVNVTDILPQGLYFFNSNIMPDSSDGNVIWTIKSLSPGETRSIEITTKIHDPVAGLINRAIATGHFDGSAVTDEDYWDISDAWLSCCNETGADYLKEKNPEAYVAGGCSLPACMGTAQSPGCGGIEGMGEAITAGDVGAEELCACSL